MAQKYGHLIKPIVIGNTVLRNRLYATKGLNMLIQGFEKLPTEATMMYYANLAKSGAAVVTVRAAEKYDREKAAMFGGRKPIWDKDDPSMDNYYTQIVDLIHFYGAKAAIGIQRQEPKGYNISAITNDEVLKNFSQTMLLPRGEEISVEGLEQMKADIVKSLVHYKSLGFDMCNLYMSYRASILACAFSPRVNKRTDKYGGSLENRCRLVLELCQEIKRACGKDFLIEVQLSGEEDEVPSGGYTIEDTIAFCKMAEGLVDIIQLRAPHGDLAHPTGLNSTEEAPLTLKYSQAIKESGAKIVTVPVGGFQDPELANRFIAEGRADMIGMARAFICDSDYYKKILSGSGSDVVPCIRCNNCHGITYENGPWLCMCSVNPEVGIKHRLHMLTDAPQSVKNVAVIGGGPAGMRAALIARQRGHNVTLFEKRAVLGGQLIHADFASFKWPLRKYKNWLIDQLKQQGVKVVLNTEPTPEMISSGGFDSVIACTGALPKRLDIPGGNGADIWSPVHVFGNESRLGSRVVVVGGSETGVETALYLADAGHKVTVLTRQKSLAQDANEIHYIKSLRTYWQNNANFSFITEAHTTAVTGKSVTYTTADGQEKTIECDSVVISAGVAPETASAISYSGTAEQFLMAGDCVKPGRIYEATRAAFGAATQI